MGAYKYIKESFQQSYKERSEAMKNRLMQWNSESTLIRIEKPTNIARAREIGYKDKQGVVIVRARVRKGLSKRAKPRGGRKPSKSGRFFARRKSMQSIAEDRASARFTNCEVVNSYYAGEDGKNRYYEVILVDRASPSVSSDPIYSRVIGMKGRAFRGLTSSGKKHRGLVGKSEGTDVSRPSVRAVQRAGS